MTCAKRFIQALAIKPGAQSKTPDRSSLREHPAVSEPRPGSWVGDRQLVDLRIGRTGTESRPLILENPALLWPGALTPA